MNADRLELLPYHLGILKLEPGDKVPEKIFNSAFYSVTGSEHELSIVAAYDFLVSHDSNIPKWRAFRFCGTLDFNMTGVLSKISGLLARAQISIFAISTFETDYILVQEKDLEMASAALIRHYEILELKT
jgi:hypothetical protein